MELTEGGCSRGSTQWAPGLRLNAVQPTRNRFLHRTSTPLHRSCALHRPADEHERHRHRGGQ